MAIWTLIFRGTNGTVVTPVHSGLLVDLILQSDGKILVTGEETTFPSGLLVARYLTNGVLTSLSAIRGSLNPLSAHRVGMQSR